MQTTDGTQANQVPTVSIIVPAYNVAPFISETLDSVFSQTFKDFEVIVINDGSPDTRELESTLERYLDRITYLKQANRGAAAARNAGLAVARGEFVAFLDGDDLWFSNFLSEQMAFIRSDAGYDLVYADGINFGDPVYAGRRNMETNPSRGEVNFLSLLRADCNVITSTVVARRELIAQVGYFDEDFPNSQDFDLWLRLAKDGRARISYQRKVLVKRRIYQGSLASDPTKSFAGEIRVLNKMSDRTDLTPEERSAIATTLARRQAEVAVIEGKRSLAKEDFAAAAESFQFAYEQLGSWKLRFVLIWLRVAPTLLRRINKLRPIW